MAKPSIAVHGGAGTILRSAMTAELEREYRTGLENALKAGWEILKKGGAALDAVEAAVVSLEDFPLFNAGRGSVFTHEGKNEMDAAVMASDTATRGRGDMETGDAAISIPHSAIRNPQLRAGAVAAIHNVRNPIKLARLVMEKTEHVLLVGDGANKFAAEMGVQLEPDEYFFTELRWRQLQEAIAAGSLLLDHSGAETRGRGDAEDTGGNATVRERAKYPQSTKGTVGAVACDSFGDLAAATSTGGMTNKKFGRVGDTPIIGAGTYADENVAVSCTGHGEYFIIASAAYDVAARMKYKSLTLEQAASETIEQLTTIGGEGGLIAVDKNGNVTLQFNSEGMYRGFARENEMSIEIYR